MKGLRNLLIYLNGIGIVNDQIIEIKNYFEANNLNFEDIRKIDEFIDLLDFLRPATKLRLKNFDEGFFERLDNHLKGKDTKIISIFDENYPENLKYIDNPPQVLYLNGYIPEEVKIGVVGARKYSDYGEFVTKKFVRELTDLGAVIVSGLAYGIDSIAHRTCLENKGKTIGVLGNGVDVIYPYKNQSLYEKVSKNGGVISEYPFETQPLPFRFPERNRIISGLSSAIIVMEARTKSGSLITARIGAEQGKEIFSVPGNINSPLSEGTNLLIRDGAYPLLSIDDILSKISELNQNKKMVALRSDELGEDEKEIYELIYNGIKDVEKIAANSKYNISFVSGILTVLELKGFIEEVGKGEFSIR